MHKNTDNDESKNDGLVPKIVSACDQLKQLRRKQPFLAAFIVVAFVLYGAFQVLDAYFKVKDKISAPNKKENPIEIVAKPTPSQKDYVLNLHFDSSELFTRQWVFQEPNTNRTLHEFRNKHLYMSKPGGATNWSIIAYLQYKFDGQWAVTVEVKHLGTGNVSAGLRVKTDNGWIDIYLTTVGAAGKNNPIYEVYGTSEINQISDPGNGFPYASDDVLLQVRKTGRGIETWYADPQELGMGWRPLRKVLDLTGEATAELFITQESPAKVDPSPADSVSFTKMSIVGTDGGITNCPVQ